MESVFIHALLISTIIMLVGVVPPLIGLARALRDHRPWAPAMRPAPAAAGA